MTESSKKLNIEKICVALMCIYLFLTYVAVNVWISSSWVSIALYVFLGVGVLYILIISSVSKTFKMPVYSWWYLVFMIVSIFSMLYSPTQDMFSGMFYRMIISFVLTYLFILLINTKSRFRIFSWSIVLGSTMLNLMLIIEGKFVGLAGDRLGQELVGNANAFARMIMTAVLMGSWLLFCDSNKYVYKNKIFKQCWIILKVILVVSILLNMYAIAMAASRSYFVLPFIFIYALIVYKQKGYKVVLYSLIFIVAIILVFNIIMTVPEFYNAIGIRFEQMLNGVTGMGNADNSTTVRNEMRIIALQKWLESPIWGYGFDSFKYYAQEALGHFYYSHCNYTELLYNGGLIVFIVYYWIYYKLYKDILKSKNTPIKYKAFAIALILTFLIFDFASIMYDAIISQAMLVLAFKGLGFKEKKSDLLYRGGFNE